MRPNLEAGYLAGLSLLLFSKRAPRPLTKDEIKRAEAYQKLDDWNKAVDNKKAEKRARRKQK